MTDEQFEALVGRLEAEARQNPGAYQFKVLLLALLGNGYLGAVLLLIAVLLLGLILSLAVLKALAVKLILIVGAFLWMVLRALWIRIAPPDGTEVKPAQAPALFAMIDELRYNLGAPRFHHVLITDDFNAGVVQSPRLGLLGLYRNYLLIGLPLMKSLTADQFKAVLAHEFGHLARGHGRLSNWIYRQRLRWSRLLGALEANEGKGSFLFRPFLNWYAPYFNAYSFPLARANEYEADATSVRLTSARAAAEALTGVNVIGSYLAERYWPAIHGQADEQPQPGFAPYTRMGQGVAAEVDDGAARNWLDQALARQTNYADTHPSLKDRLGAIGEPPRVAPPRPGEAADRLLGGALAPISESFDERWRANILPAWEQRHQEVQEGRRALAELNEKLGAGAELSLQEAYDRARLTQSVGGDADDALAQFRTLHERAPDDPTLCIALGARLLARDDDNGIALIERAMALDEDATLQGCELLRDYQWRRDRKEEAHAWHARLAARAAIEQASQKERNEVTLADKFERHGLDEATLARFRSELKAIRGLRKAYFVRKKVAHFAERPLYVLGFSVTGMLQLHRKKRVQEVLDGIHASVGFPGETIIINVDGDNSRFGRKFRWMRGSRIC